jgi:hypothetical protein
LQSSVFSNFSKIEIAMRGVPCPSWAYIDKDLYYA